VVQAAAAAAREGQEGLANVQHGKAGGGPRGPLWARESGGELHLTACGVRSPWSHATAHRCPRIRVLPAELVTHLLRIRGAEDVVEHDIEREVPVPRAAGEVAHVNALTAVASAKPTGPHVAHVNRLQQWRRQQAALVAVALRATRQITR
jgi:hypothetical protein